MNKRYLILGNGFDIAHNLPTSYMDFLYVCSSVIEQEINHNFNDNKLKSLNIVKDLFVQKYPNIKCEIKKNSWIEYFLSEYEKLDNKWVDFEKEIKFVCESHNNADEEFFFKGAGYFKSESGVFFDLKIMKSDLNNLIEIFNKYLLCIPYENIDVFYDEIVNFLPTDVINFNYTSTFNKVYNANLKMDYVHGKIDEKNNSIVLGFDSMKDEKDDVKYGEFIKYFQMVEKDIKLNSYIKLQEFSKWNEAMFFGHSLDKNDGDIIANVVNSVGNVYIIYHDNNHKNQVIKNLIDIFGRDKFVELTLSINRRINFIKQSICKKLAVEEKDSIKKLINDINSIDFNNCTCQDLDKIINNNFVELDYNILNILLDNLQSRDQVFYDHVSNYKELESFIISKMNDI